MRAEPFKYEFIPVRMKDLDSLAGGILALGVFEEDQPPPGLPGLVDWRMDGLISRIRLATVRPDLDNPHYEGLVLGPFSATLGENLLFPAGRLLPFFMILVVGLGSRGQYNSQKYKAVVESLLDSVSSLKAEKLTLQLPGWKAAGLPARRACDLFASHLVKIKAKGRDIPAHVTLVEELEHQGEMDEKLVEIFDSLPKW